MTDWLLKPNKPLPGKLRSKESLGVLDNPELGEELLEYIGAKKALQDPFFKLYVRAKSKDGSGKVILCPLPDSFYANVLASTDLRKHLGLEADGDTEMQEAPPPKIKDEPASEPTETEQQVQAVKAEQQQEQVPVAKKACVSEDGEGPSYANLDAAENLDSKSVQPFEASPREKGRPAGRKCQLPMNVPKLDHSKIEEEVFSYEKKAFRPKETLGRMLFFLKGGDVADDQFNGMENALRLTTGEVPGVETCIAVIEEFSTVN